MMKTVTSAFSSKPKGASKGIPSCQSFSPWACTMPLPRPKSLLEAGEYLFAYLDDVYAVCKPERTRAVYDTLRRCLAEKTGIQLHEGKTRIWNRGGHLPPQLSDLGDDVWCPDGVKVLGVPIGHPAFVQSYLAEKSADQQRLLDSLPRVNDLQCAWQLLVQCAGPRANHILRSVPPSQSALVSYARKHDIGLWHAADTLLGSLPGDDQQREAARSTASLPMRLGGLGLRSAERTASAAYWASWMDALPMLSQRLPELAAKASEILENGELSGTCLDDVKNAAALLDREGYLDGPTFQEILQGRRPEAHVGGEQGEYQHGWQFYVASTREHHYRDTAVMPNLTPADRAHIRSHSGRFASAVLIGAPTSAHFEIQASDFRVLVLERLRLPVGLCDATCDGCGANIDVLGRHRGACPRSGRLKIRSVPMEKATATICREAGGTVRTNVLVRDLNVCVPADDERRMDVIAHGLPCRRGAQLVIDATLRSPLTADGEPKPHADDEDGATAERARADKERQYPELAASRQCSFTVLAIETGGRWSKEAATLIADLASAKAAEAPAFLRGPARASWTRRWSRLLATACAVSFARSLVRPKPAIAGGLQLPQPPALHDLLACGGSRCAFAPQAAQHPLLAAPGAHYGGGGGVYDG